MNNLFFSTKEEQNIINATRNNADKIYAIFDRYYNRFKAEGYEEVEACIIANLFERSTRYAEQPASELISSMKVIGNLSLHVTVYGVELYAHKDAEPVEHHHITLEEALLLHNNGIVEFDRNGLHFMEYFGLA